MKKVIFALTTLCFTTSAFAGECVDKNGKEILDQPEVFQALIEKSESCHEARELAESCAWGSGLDVYTAGLAYDVCDRELKASKPSKKLVKLLAAMQATCNETADSEGGSLGRAINAHCHLSAIGWINNRASTF